MVKNARNPRGLNNATGGRNGGLPIMNHREEDKSIQEGGE